MEQDFEDFFIHCQKLSNSNQIDIIQILKPLKFHLWKQLVKKIVKYFVFFTAICCAIYYVDTLNWYFCAIGRLIMINLLPLWDWTLLASAKCLIPKPTVQSKSNEVARSFNEKDCRACADFDEIEVFEQTTYRAIRDKFLIRGLPVVVSDSALDFNISQSLSEFLSHLTANMSEMIQQEPCDLETNLMLSSLASVGGAFTILTKTIERSQEPEPWFISFRNCKFKALKASRSMMKKPYFYPRHLQGPSTSWVLMSQNFANYTNDLNLYGLVIVTQLKGTIKVTLKPKDFCKDQCKELSLSVFDGESLTFISNLWTFSYQYETENEFSLTFITETDFN